MVSNVRALLAAPAPIFALVALVITRPSLGWTDVAISIGIAFTVSYGFLIAGFPLHLMLHRLQRAAFASYLLAFWITLAALILVLTITEGPPLPPMPDDNSPFAAMTLRNGGWIFFVLLGMPIVSVIAWAYWRFAASLRPDVY